MRVSVSRWIVGAALVFIVAACRPAVATPVEDTDAAVKASLIEPAAGTEVYIPLDFFLENLKPEPSLIETVVDRLRDLRGSIARALRALRSDEPDPGVETARQMPAPVLDVAGELGAQDPVGSDRARALADRIRGVETTPADVAGRTVLAAQDIGLKDSPTLNTDFGGARPVSLTPGSTASLDSAIVARRRPLGLPTIVMDVLLWIRHQPFLTFLAISLLGLLFWIRHAAYRTN